MSAHIRFGPALLQQDSLPHHSSSVAQVCRQNGDSPSITNKGLCELLAVELERSNCHELFP